VLIAGAGVAGLEAALALRSLAADRVDVELLGAEHHFWYRPLSVTEPFQLGEATRYELPALAVAAGARFTPGTLLGVEAQRHEATTTVGDIPYDVLVVAVGALPHSAVTGAVTFRGPADREKLESLRDDIVAGRARRIVFAVPEGAVWPLPVYELALLMAASVAENRIEQVELTLATPEAAPLQVFGDAASAAVRQLLEERGISLLCGASALEFRDGVLRLQPGHELDADRVVAAPRLQGAWLQGLPQTRLGFIPIDAYGRVDGCEDVYAAGDVVDLPVKQGGVAAELADVVATSISALVGAEVEAVPFEPVLRGLLLTGDPDRSLWLEPSGVLNVRANQRGKIAGHYLAQFLTERTDRR
jgi:sulfide:quinone oxidoreductase